ncbi:MAG: hypothetical protein VZR11_04145 [Succinimonas sp.]|nr:hypothetical protein [Succinimonas sp.]
MAEGMEKRVKREAEGVKQAVFSKNCDAILSIAKPLFFRGTGITQKKRRF